MCPVIFVQKFKYMILVIIIGSKSNYNRYVFKPAGREFKYLDCYIKYPLNTLAICDDSYPIKTSSACADLRSTIG